MTQNEFEAGLSRTLAYYEIFRHPLTKRELYALSPVSLNSYADFSRYLEEVVRLGTVVARGSFYCRAEQTEGIEKTREDRQRIAAKRIRTARRMGGLIRRFPFVRAVFVSGDLSKGVATKESDIDYVVLTKPGRLWICRTILILFKKLFLLNSKKYFCMNYFVADNHLEIQERNYYVATEIAHLKPLVNVPLFLRFMNSNSWIKGEFPNYSISQLTDVRVTKERSVFQRLLELLFAGRWADRVEHWLMVRMERVWERRYTEFDEETRRRIFRCTPHESRAFVGNFSERVDALYREKLDPLLRPADRPNA